MDVKSVRLYYSDFVNSSVAVKNYIEINTIPVIFIALNTDASRKLTELSDYGIKGVPTLLIEFRNQSFLKRDGQQQILEWLQKFVDERNKNLYNKKQKEYKHIPLPPPKKKNKKQVVSESESEPSEDEDTDDFNSKFSGSIIQDNLLDFEDDSDFNKAPPKQESYSLLDQRKKRQQEDVDVIQKQADVQRRMFEQQTGINFDQDED